MKKGFKVLTVLSLFGLGLGGLTGCGGTSTPEKTISISVDDKAVANGGSATVTQSLPFTLSATVEGGDSDDVVVWSTNAASAITFSPTTGASVTATSNTATSTGWKISASLEGDASVSSTITVIVSEAVVEYSISVDTTEAKTTYETGEAFDPTGIYVTVHEKTNGVDTDSYEIGSDQFSFKLADGTTLSEGYIFRESGDVKVTVVPTDESLGTAEFTLTVDFEPTYLVQEVLNGFQDGSQLVNYVYVPSEDSQYGFELKSYDIFNYEWNNNIYISDYDSGYNSIYHQTNSGVEKYSIGISSDNYTATKIADNIYNAYSPIKTLSTIKSLNSIVTAMDFVGAYDESALQYSESNEGTYLFNVDLNSDFGQLALTVSGIEYDDLVYQYTMYGMKVQYQMMAAVSPENGALMFTTIAVTQASQGQYAALAERVTMLASVDPNDQKGDIYSLEDAMNKSSSTVATKSPLFTQAADLIRAHDFDAQFGNGLFSNIYAEYHANENYIVSDVFFEESSSGKTYVSTSGMVTLPGGTFTSGDTSTPITAGDYSFIYDGEVTYDDEQNATYSPELIFNTNQTEYENTQSYFQKLDFGFADTSFNVANIDGLIEYTDPEFGSFDQYWDTEYEFTAVDNSDPNNPVTFSQGSYNFYGDTSYSYFSLFTGLLGGYWDQLVELAGLPTTLGQCKLNLFYQQVEGDWTDPTQSFIRLTLYIADCANSESAVQNLGSIDAFTIYNIGNGGSTFVDNMLSKITPAA